MRPREEAVLRRALEVARALYGPIVLALLSHELDADPFTLAKGREPSESDDAHVTKFGAYARANGNARLSCRVRIRSTGSRRGRCWLLRCAAFLGRARSGWNAGRCWSCHRRVE